jgi:hypothetical protein
MDISFNCKKCGQHILIDESAAGLSVICPSCSAQISVPAESAQRTLASPPPKLEQTGSRKSRRFVVAASALVGITALALLGVFILNQRAAAGAKARLELATQRSDLDAMFLALKELQALGNDSPEIEEQLAHVQTGIPLLQKIRLYQSDHNHEEVVKAAGQFLDYFPDHPEARRAIKESGAIFAYLQEALNSLGNCFQQDAGDKVKMVQKTADEVKINDDFSKNDFPKIFFNLNKAEKSVAEAKKLDPQFDQALVVEKMVSDTKNAVSYSVSYGLITYDGVFAGACVDVFNGIYSAMESALASQTASPSDLWKELEPGISQSESNLKNTLDELDEISSCLTSLKGQGTPEIIQVARDMHVKTIQLKDAVLHPTGSMIEYRRNVETKQTELLDLSRKIKSSAPNANELLDNDIGFLSVASKHELFKTPTETKPVLERYKRLIAG